MEKDPEARKAESLGGESHRCLTASRTSPLWKFHFPENLMHFLFETTRSDSLFFGR